MRIEKDKIEKLKELLSKSNKIAITCHVTPDGDAIGSSLGLFHVLTQLGKEVNVISPDTPPTSLSFLPGFQKITIASKHTEKAPKAFENADLIFCLDFNTPKRIDKLEDILLNSQGNKILIDHHPYPDAFANIIISHPEMSSTCELLYVVLKELGLSNYVEKDAAECIYTGMLTDTGNFSYNSNDPTIYLIIAELLEKGLDKDMIYEKAWNTNSVNRLRICGYALAEKMELFKEQRLALITLTKDELQKYGYVKGDTEGLVNKPLSIPSIVKSVFMRADEEDFVKISMRSKGNNPVNTICSELYGGGGHLNAAGGEFNGTLQDAIMILKENLHLTE